MHANVRMDNHTSKRSRLSDPHWTCCDCFTCLISVFYQVLCFIVSPAEALQMFPTQASIKDWDSPHSLFIWFPQAKCGTILLCSIQDHLSTGKTSRTACSHKDPAVYKVIGDMKARRYNQHILTRIYLTSKGTLKKMLLLKMALKLYHTAKYRYFYLA